MWTAPRGGRRWRPPPPPPRAAKAWAPPSRHHMRLRRRRCRRQRWRCEVLLLLFLPRLLLRGRPIRRRHASAGARASPLLGLRLGGSLAKAKISALLGGEKGRRHRRRSPVPPPFALQDGPHRLHRLISTSTSSSRWRLAFFFSFDVNMRRITAKPYAAPPMRCPTLAKTCDATTMRSPFA